MLTHTDCLMNTLFADKQKKLEVVTIDGISIDVEKKVTLTSLPKSLTVIRSSDVPLGPVTVCHWEGVTYVGIVNGTVVKIDSNYWLQVYKDRLYVLVL